MRLGTLPGLLSAVTVSAAAMMQPLDEGDPALPPPRPLPPGLVTDRALAEDVSGPEAIVAAYYESLSGPAGQARQWERFRSLFVTDARLIPVRRDPHDKAASLILIPVEGYIDLNRKYFEKGGFFERQIASRTERFGNVAHVWSTYESRRAGDEPEPYSRGVYSFQLANDGERWWIVNVMWERESQSNPLPRAYLPAGKE